MAGNACLVWSFSPWFKLLELYLAIIQETPSDFCRCVLEHVVNTVRVVARVKSFIKT